MDIKRIILCGFLFIICFLLLRWLNNEIITESYVSLYGGNDNIYINKI
jgi:hypothetical protein